MGKIGIVSKCFYEAKYLTLSKCPHLYTVSEENIYFLSVLTFKIQNP